MNTAPKISCATKFPWYEHPFRLISWLEMNQFSAESFLRIGGFLENLCQELRVSSKVTFSSKSLTEIYECCQHVGLSQSAKFIQRINNTLKEGMTTIELQVKIDDLSDLIAREPLINS